MVRYDKQIINALLDSYENSRAFKNENKINRSVQFTVSRKALPAYFDESSSEYEAVHEGVKALEAQGLVRCVWKSGRILDKVILNIDALEKAYRYLGRKPKTHVICETLHMLEEYEKRFDTPVCRRLFDYLKERLQAGKSVKKYFDFKDKELFENTVKAVNAVEINGAPCYIREFSIRLFNDSKTFEGIKGKVVVIFRSFDEECAGKGEKEIFAEHDIYHTPDYVYVKGCAALYVKGQLIYLGDLKQGIGISGDDLEGVEILLTPEIKCVFTIENLTTFFRYEGQNALIIYLGGYHNTVRRRLLKSIYEAFPEAEYRHFGDIDAGGFEIYRDLKGKTGIPFRVYKMDSEILQTYRMYGRPLNENDRRRLTNMLETMKDDECYAEISEAIRYMLAENVKLEQECVEVGELGG